MLHLERPRENLLGRAIVVEMRPVPSHLRVPKTTLERQLKQAELAESPSLFPPFSPV